MEILIRERITSGAGYLHDDILIASNSLLGSDNVEKKKRGDK